jgi:hypothetical protein
MSLVLLRQYPSLPLYQQSTVNNMDLVVIKNAVTLQHTTYPSEERTKQKIFLREIFSDYNAKRHEAFVYQYNQMLDKQRTVQYMKSRGIV